MPWAKAVHHAAYHDVITRQFGGFDESEQDAFFQKAWNETVHDIIEKDGEKVGYCSLQYFPDYIFLHTLVIAPDYQNQGIGKELLEQVLNEAQIKKIPARLRVLKQNRAQQLYQRVGFTVIEEQKEHFLLEYVP